MAAAVDSRGGRVDVRAAIGADPVAVVDTNGAGDAFFAGFLAASLSGADPKGCLAAGARQAVVALSSEHLHPAVAAVAAEAALPADGAVTSAPR